MNGAPLKLAIVACSAALAFAAGRYLQAEEDPGKATTEQPENRDGDELARLRYEVNRLKHDRVSRSSSSDPDSRIESIEVPNEPRNEEGPPPTEEELEDARREDYERAEARAQLIEEAIEQEPIDDDWAESSNALVDELVADFQQDGKTTRLTRLDCRTTMCVAEFGHDSAKEMSDFTLELMQLDGFGSASGIQHGLDGEGPVSSTVYLAREGQSLPKS